jgi:hypothetical protein
MATTPRYCALSRGAALRTPSSLAARDAARGARSQHASRGRAEPSHGLVHRRCRLPAPWHQPVSPSRTPRAVSMLPLRAPESPTRAGPARPDRGRAVLARPAPRSRAALTRRALWARSLGTGCKRWWRRCTRSSPRTRSSTSRSPASSPPRRPPPVRVNTA